MVAREEAGLYAEAVGTHTAFCHDWLSKASGLAKPVFTKRKEEQKKLNWLKVDNLSKEYSSNLAGHTVFTTGAKCKCCNFPMPN